MFKLWLIANDEKYIGERPRTDMLTKGIGGDKCSKDPPNGNRRMIFDVNCSRSYFNLLLFRTIGKAIMKPDELPSL